MFDVIMKTFNDLFDDCGCGCNLDPVSWDAKPLRSYSKTLEDKTIVVVEVPGINQDKILVEYKDNILQVTAEYDEKDELTTRRGKYKTAYRINDIDEGAITAKINDGLLTIELPKKKADPPKRIEIKKE